MAPAIDYRIVWNDDYLLTDGIHQPIVSVEDWEEAQARLRSQATKYKRYDRQENEHAYLLTGIIKCPECRCRYVCQQECKEETRRFLLQGVPILWLQASADG